MHIMIIKKVVIIFLLGLTISCSQQNHQNTSANPVNEDKVPVKVVIVTMFEIGADEGDEIGEFQLWKERRELNKKFEFPQSHHDLFYNSETQTLGMVTGIGTANSAAAIMALGLDPRFDLSRAYWLVAGIAGIDPEDASIGSVVWSSFLVDGDLGYELDAREIPDDWSTGYLHFDTSTPFETPRPKISGEGRAYCCHKEVFVANPSLRDWAHEKTQDLKLFDEESLWDTRNLYSEHPNARKAPEVLKGGHIAEKTCRDLLLTQNRQLIFENKRIPGGTQVRGTGCRLASAITYYLAINSLSLEGAVKKANNYLHEYILENV